MSMQISVVYSDLSNYAPNVITNEDSIVQSVTTLLQCNKYDRFFNPEAYIDTDRLFFELDIPQIRSYYAMQLSSKLVRKEPRLKEVVAEITSGDEPHVVYIDVVMTTVTGDSISVILKMEK